jgi:RNA polymerase sigma factor (sigma-70 family)
VDLKGEGHFMDEQPGRTADDIDDADVDKSPNAVARRFAHMIEVIATQERVRRKLPASAEEELRACGNLGLSEALAKFDPSRGNKLSTYAEPRIRGAIRNGAIAMQRAHRRVAIIVARGPADPELDGSDKWDRISNLLEEVVTGELVAASVEEEYAKREECAQTRAAMAEIPRESRELLLECYVDELTGDELAARRGLKHRSSIMRQRQRAESALKEKLLELGKKPRGA